MVIQESFSFVKEGKQVPEKLYYKIREVGKILLVKPYVLRFWESEFKSIKPAKSKSGQRLYRQKDIETIKLIQKLLYEDGFTIAGAKQRLKEMSHDQKTTKPRIEKAPSEVLKTLRKEIQDLVEEIG